MKSKAEKTPAGVRYRVWAPEKAHLALDVQPAHSSDGHRRLAMVRDPAGYHEALDPAGQVGDAYKYVLEDGTSLPDPASRGQVDGVHGPSMVVDASTYPWTDAGWTRPPFRDLVIYELHVGTFTPTGTFLAAIEKLPHLTALGVNAIELMPVGDFPGRWGWGYDGVLIYAPARAYGRPDDLRALVEAAHRQGIAVILDVVYNHFGPDGNYLGQFTRAFFHKERHTPWGAAFNFDGENSEQVRDFFVSNPIYWMEQFHIDGFRFDATHEIEDASPRHLFAEMTAAIHQRGGYAIAEDSRNEAQIIADIAEGGHGFDAVWADDFHHSARVGQTGVREGYFEDFEGTLEETLDALRHGWIYRGQMKRMAKEKRGTECGHLPPSRFIHCLSNHDQTGNRAFGERLHHSITPESYRALSMLLCLTPYTPLLFMGQEWASSTPFLFFTDHNAELGPLITEGRRREFSGFSGFRDHDALERIPDPQSEETFLRSKLKWDETNGERHAQTLALYAECLQLRRSESAFRPESRESWEVGRLSFGVGAIRFEGKGASYLLVLDLTGGHEGFLAGEAMAKCAGSSDWKALLSTEEERFGGDGTLLFEPDGKRCRFRAPGAVLLRSC